MDLKDGLEKMLSRYQLKKPMLQEDALAIWKDTCGPLIAKYTTNVYIKEDTLHVYLQSAPLRKELLLRKEDLIKRFNTSAGMILIKDCTFR